MSMKERPILFSAPMVRALLAGTKTQTRRVVKARKDPDYGCHMSPGEIAGDEHPERLCPHGKPGDRLWVRETWYCDDYRVQRGPYLKPDDMDVAEARSDGTLCYAADNRRPYEAEQPVWKPSIHMPRWASRITLQVTGVRAERLQDISAADAWAEGIPGAPPLGVHIERMDEWVRWSDGVMRDDPRSAYRALWEHINGPGSWDANPWVWVLEFRRGDEQAQGGKP